ncbi:ribonuclease T2-like protein [Podospora australis]|uniref:ribonuclease T2 n=1 Tax=Podospora australis TaxID=1536484 RepID=A0AAN6WZH4_9PEZI|nr:ribonuclease T2-like protein [Podospora australis]
MPQLTAPSLRDLFSYAGGLIAQSPIFGSIASNRSPAVSNISPYEPCSGAPSCPIDGPISCHNSTPIADPDSCCFVYPGGRMLLTQFWDEQVHAGGAEEDWTLHGLWPDLCDGGYDQFCHMTPQYRNITSVLEHYGRADLVKLMNRYWLAASGPNSYLWEHEFNKHATCINTLAPRCYGDSHTPGLEVVDYFSRAMALFQMLDTYHALERAGIVPHPRKHYPLADVQKALEAYSGGKVVLRCGGHRNILHEAWYAYFVKGSLQTGDFVPAKDLAKEGDAGNCAPWIKYLPKKRRGILSSWSGL